MMTYDRLVSYSPLLRVAPGISNLEAAILRTLAYADVFDFPLNAGEIYRYLIGMQSTQEEVKAALDSGSAKIAWLRNEQGYYTLEGRQGLVDLRRRRESAGKRRWPAARRYGKWIASVPFVRMVSVTGALAVNNEEGPDLDYLVVTVPGRLWLCRGMVMLLVHWARRYGDEICPNYFLSESALVLTEENLYSAHEMAQMIPLSGFDVYRRIRKLNRWVEAFLPNAKGSPHGMATIAELNRFVLTARRAAQKSLCTEPGDWLERWEMRRKIRKLQAQDTDHSEADFCADWCKGHFGGYATKTREAYSLRLQSLGLDDGFWELG